MSRISYRNYPVLKRILPPSDPKRVQDIFKGCLFDSKERGHLLPFYFEFERDYNGGNELELYGAVGGSYNATISIWERNHYKTSYLSESFKSAALLAKPKLLDAMFSIFSGVWSIHKGVYLFANSSIVYHIANYKGAERYISFYEFDNFDNLTRAFIFKRDEPKFCEGLMFGDSAGFENFYSDLPLNFGGWGAKMYETIFTYICFKKYAKVEIVESKARTKIHAYGCKYLNETDVDINYLDSKWFTSLVNSKGFKVGGHFRLQPKKKDGEWTKELIWIEDFEKKGYNRKAGILC